MTNRLLIRYRIIILIFSMATAGCSGSPGGHSFRVTTEDGVPVATTSGGPRYQTPPFRFEEVLKVQQDDDVPESLLGDPQRLAPGPEGTLVVVEPNDVRIVVYDGEGRFLRVIGEEGSGPGQFQLIVSMDIRGDVLEFYDPSLMRITRMDIHGDVKDVISTRESRSLSRVHTLGADRFLLEGWKVSGEGDFAYRSVTATVVEAEGDTVAALRTEPARWGTVRARMGDQIMMTQAIPMVGDPFTMLLPGERILMTSGWEPRVDLCDAAGGILRSVRLDLPRRPVTPEMVDAYWASEERRMAVMNRTVTPQMKADRVLPEEAGWWGRAIPDDAGFLWLMDAVSEGLGFDATDFFLFDPEGRWLGKVEVPVASGRIVAGLLYGIRADPETGLREPTIYRVVPAVAGLEYR